MIRGKLIIGAGRGGFLTAPVQSVSLILRSTINDHINIEADWFVHLSNIFHNAVRTENMKKEKYRVNKEITRQVRLEKHQPNS